MDVLPCTFLATWKTAHRRGPNVSAETPWPHPAGISVPAVLHLARDALEQLPGLDMQQLSGWALPAWQLFFHHLQI